MSTQQVVDLERQQFGPPSPVFEHENEKQLMLPSERMDTEELMDKYTNTNEIYEPAETVTKRTGTKRYGYEKGPSKRYVVEETRNNEDSNEWKNKKNVPDQDQDQAWKYNVKNVSAKHLSKGKSKIRHVLENRDEEDFSHQVNYPSLDLKYTSQNLNDSNFRSKPQSWEGQNRGSGNNYSASYQSGITNGNMNSKGIPQNDRDFVNEQEEVECGEALVSMCEPLEGVDEPEDPDNGVKRKIMGYLSASTYIVRYGEVNSAIYKIKPADRINLNSCEKGSYKGAKKKIPNTEKVGTYRDALGYQYTLKTLHGVAWKFDDNVRDPLSLIDPAKKRKVKGKRYPNTYVFVCWEGRDGSRRYEWETRTTIRTRHQGGTKVADGKIYEAACIGYKNFYRLYPWMERELSNIDLPSEQLPLVNQHTYNLRSRQSNNEQIWESCDNLFRGADINSLKANNNIPREVKNLMTVMWEYRQKSLQPDSNQPYEETYRQKIEDNQSEDEEV